jgi:hypothetical protein
MLFAVCAVFVADTNRLLAPVGEKYIDYIGRGSSDLIPSFNAAWALIDGANPYHSDPQRYPDPYADTRGAAQKITYLYPPTHGLIYVPLAWATGRNFRVAARAHYFVTLFFLAALSVAIVELVALITPIDGEQRLSLGLLSLFVLGVNAGSQLGFERGQSDVVSANACWWAVLCFCRGRFALAVFLATLGGLLKGYGVPLAIGLALLGLTRARLLGTFSGGLAALLLLLAPVARYLPDALAGFSVRSAMFWPAWYNQSFYHLAWRLFPKSVDRVRYALLAFAGAVYMVAWLRLYWLTRKSPPERGVDHRVALGATMFATAALIFILAFSRNSFAYDAVLILPGALIIALTQQGRLTKASWSAALVAGALAVMLFLLCAFSAPQWLGLSSPANELPLHAAGQLGLCCVIAASALRTAVWMR